MPDARIDVVMKPQVAPVLDGLPWIDRRLLFDPRSNRPELERLERQEAATGGRLRPGRACYPTRFDPRSCFASGECGGSVGYARGGRGVLLNVRLTPAYEAGTGRFLPTPAVEYYAALARAVDCPVNSLATRAVHDRAG